MTKKALVVGAGLAGLTAAIELVDAGVAVTLAERRPFAGGRTFSFTDDAGDVLDNGQHVFLGCCTAYLELLRKLGQRDKAFLQDRLEVSILDAVDGPARLREAPLPAPFHLLPSFLRLPYLSPGEKLVAIAALLAIRLRALPEEESFASWLASRGQTPNAIQRFWNLILVPTCNAPAERVSAAQGGFVFREGLLRTRWGGRLGYPRVSLSEIVPEKAVGYLRQRGAELRFGTAVERLDGQGALTAHGEHLPAGACILAVPWNELPRLIPDPWAQRAAGLESAPVVGINLWYDRPIFAGEVLAAIVDGEAHWLFDRTRILGLPGPAHHIAVSISAADGVIHTPRRELAGQVAAKLAKALPAAAHASLLRSSVEKVRSATFVPGPGSRRVRLGTATPRPNLFLAGSWLDTGWPDTMESAVRAGQAAARLAQDFLQKARD
jgi:hydroxysqualene dehydroxylase